MKKVWVLLAAAVGLRWLDVRSRWGRKRQKKRCPI